MIHIPFYHSELSSEPAETGSGGSLMRQVEVRCDRLRPARTSVGATPSLRTHIQDRQEREEGNK